MWSKRTLPVLVGLWMLLATWQAHVAMGQANQQKIAHWSMDDSGGSVAADSVGGNDGSIQGGAKLATNGRVGSGSLELDGYDGYIRVADSPELNPTTAITIAAWVNVDTWDNSNSRIVQKGNGDNQYRLTSEWKKMRFDLRDVGTLDVDLPDTDRWVHIAATYDGLQMCIYCDGVLVGSKTACGLIAANGDPLCIGGKNGGQPMDCLKGSIDDVAVFGWALDASQIAQVYSNGVSAFLDSQPSIRGEAAIVSRTATAITNIAKNQKAEAEAAVEGLLSTHASDVHIVPSAIAVANAYMRQSKHDKAQVLLQEALMKDPSPDQVVGAYKGLAITSIELGRLEEAADYTSVIRDEFSKHEDSPLALYQIADEYYGKKKAAKAIGLYGDVADRWPESEQAIWSCMKMVQHHLKNKDENAADAVREKFLALPTDHMLYPAGVRELAYAYERTGFGEEACTLNKYNVEHFPDSIFAMWSQGAMTHYYIRRGLFDQAEEAYEELLAVFPGQPTLAKEVAQVGDMYLQRGKCDRAEHIYQYVLGKWPGDEQIVWARAGMIKVDVVLGKESGIKARIDTLVDDFKENLALPEAVSSIAEALWTRAAVVRIQGSASEYRAATLRALAEWDRIIEDFPDAESQMGAAYYFSGECYEALREPHEALERYAAVARDWPDFKYASSAQLLVARCLERLIKAKEVTLEEGAERICQACQAVLDDYPESRSTGAARVMLRQWERAIEGGRK